MQSDSGRTTSIWMATAEIAERPPLAGDAECDVCIVGAGIAGMSTAYLLARAGKRVVVLDDGPIGGGETGRTTAHLVWALDDYYQKIEQMHGQEGARLAAESHMAAVNRIEAIVRTEGIDCAFERVDGYWFAADRHGVKLLDDEAQAAPRAGASDVERLARIPGAPFETPAALRFPNQAQFHPLRYLDGLARAIERDGGRIHCGSHVQDLDKSGARPRVKTADGHTVTADAIVFATNSPVNDWVTMHTKQAPYRTYVIGARVPDGSVPRALYWDTLDPYHYVRLANDDRGEVLIVGGEDHKTGQADDMERRFEALAEWTRRHFPMVTEIAYRWSGQVLEPVDYMGFIGRNPGDRNVFIATGDSGNGMTHGTIAGMLITDLVVGRDNPWATLYDPGRISLRAAPEFLRENLNVAVQYTDYAKPGDVDSPDAIPPGQGAVIRRGTKMVAVYRDEDGTVHERSAVCTHLYCIVDWNHMEKTWDCPCHGSRFDRYGEVVNGPAITGLQPADEPPSRAPGASEGAPQGGGRLQRARIRRAGRGRGARRDSAPPFPVRSALRADRPGGVASVGRPDPAVTRRQGHGMSVNTPSAKPPQFGPHRPGAQQPERAVRVEGDQLGAAPASGEAREVPAPRGFSDWLATMSHELRTPLNAILGYADLLLLGLPHPLPEESRMQVDRMRLAARHLLQLLDEILTFARVEAGQELVRPAPVSVGPVVREAAAQLERHAQPRRLRVAVSVSETPITATTDETKLRQILTYLGASAVALTAQGTVTLAARAEEDALVLEVRDTGSGIPPERLARVFDPNWQGLGAFGDRDASPAVGGAGLGLTLAYLLTRLLGGTIDARSRVGIGTVFTVRLPRHAGAPAEPPARAD